MEAFRFFGGVFALVRYDNLRSAVKQVLRGRRRTEQDRFVALRSHYLFESAFTRAGRAGAHEKGGVEGEVGRYRRAHLVPVPKVATPRELNDLLEDGCFQDFDRRIRGRSETVGEAFRIESRALRELPFEDFDSSERASPRVDSKALVTIRQNRYSVPVALVGLRVQATIGARQIVICHERREVARHARLYGRFQTCARLDHYLELLRIKPRALKGSLRCARSASAAAGPPATTSSGRRSKRATAPPRRPGTWSTSSSSAASTDLLASSSPSAAPSPPERTTVAPSPCSPAEANGRRSRRCSSCPPARARRPQPTLGDYDTFLSRGGTR